jgi:hypothetical protein
VRFTKPAVLYRETISRAATGFVAYTMPKPCWAVMEFYIEPGERGSGVVFESQCHVRDILGRYQNQVRQALPLEEALGVAAQDNSGVTELMELLQLIPEIYKDTVILHCLEGHSLEETADLLGISLSAAKMRLSRAREALRALREED